MEARAFDTVAKSKTKNGAVYMKKLGIIGAGNMASAFINGVLGKKCVSHTDIMVYDIDGEKLRPFKENDIAIARDEKEIILNCHYVLLSIKPQVYKEVLTAISPFCSKSNVFISIAAGISGEYIKNIIGVEEKVVLVMPNTPLLVGYGACAVSKIEPTSEMEFAVVKSFFEASGIVSEIEKDQMNDVIAINGSSPALFYWLAQIFVDDAVKKGFSYETANKLFCATMQGASKMIMQTGKSHQELIDMVSSKGGTTIAMREAMDTGGFKKIVVSGIDACTKRAYELGSKA
jgi:pyrroline-5-carboxylate reductase